MSLSAGEDRMSSDTEMDIIRPDVLVMYGIALILDMAGIILFFLGLTILLAPIAIVLQWIVALIGNVLFSVWILFLRPGQAGSVRQSSAPSIKSQTQRISAKKGSSQKADGTPPPSSASSTPSAKGSSQKADGTPPPSSTSSTSSAKGSMSTSLATLPAKNGSTSIKKWFKQVLLIWLIESIPLIGAISCTWIVAVYLEQKKG